jgi:hypothetical protein
MRGPILRAPWRARPGALATACALAALAVAPACGGELTEIVVVVDTDLQAPSEVDEILVQVIGPSGLTKQARRRLGPEAALPVTLGLVPSGDEAPPVTIEATARRMDATVVATEVRTSFLRGRRLLVRMTLLSTCVPVQPTCGADETCRDGRCEAAAVDPATLPGFDGQVTRVVDAGPPDLPVTEDAGSDGGAEDAGPGDAGVEDAGPEDGGSADGATGDAGPEDGGGRDAAGPGCTSDIDCLDRNPCTDGVCDLASGRCTQTFNTAACDDGNACTTGERCSAGVCGGGMPVLCRSMSCTTASCDPTRGCVQTPRPDGTGCELDGNSRTCDVCASGACVASSTSCGRDCVCAYAEGLTPYCSGGPLCEVRPE